MSTDRNDLGNRTNKIESAFNPVTQTRFSSQPPPRPSHPIRQPTATPPTLPPYSVYSYSKSSHPNIENADHDLGEVKDDGQLLKTMQSLFRACQLAHSCNRPEWDFAVEVQELRYNGISSADLRWLMANGWVEHRLEITTDQQSTRQFEKTPGFKIGDSSCFQLTEIGKELAEELELTARSRAANKPLDQSAETCQPNWDNIRHELRLGSQLVKKFKWRAQNQEAILSAFEEEDWPPRIDDPLPPVLGKNPKRRLSDAIKCLNRHQNLSLIRFSGDGTGEGVLWERVEPAEM